jgi:hypothetical protein
VELSTGPLTSLLASCAAAAGSGTLLGGLAAGLIGVLRSRESDDLDVRVRRAGYYGGALGLSLLVIDQLIG